MDDMFIFNLSLMGDKVEGFKIKICPWKNTVKERTLDNTTKFAGELMST